MCRAGNLYLLCRDCDDAVATGVWHDRCEHYDFHSDTCAEAIEWDSSDERSQRSSIALCDSCDEASQQSSNESTSYAVEVEAAATISAWSLHLEDEQHHYRRALPPGIGGGGSKLSPSTARLSKLEESAIHWSPQLKVRRRPLSNVNTHNTRPTVSSSTNSVS
ncbi:hypothetical protein OC844_000833 [Tilletia horrida]|nr:hypothetical protein OC844_000833 [Tilletia horrida]